MNKFKTTLAAAGLTATAFSTSAQADCGMITDTMDINQEASTVLTDYAPKDVLNGIDCKPADGFTSGNRHSAAISKSDVIRLLKVYPNVHISFQNVADTTPANMVLDEIKMNINISPRLSKAANIELVAAMLLEATTRGFVNQTILGLYEATNGLEGGAPNVKVVPLAANGELLKLNIQPQ